MGGTTDACQCTSAEEITQLVISWSDGDRQALERLIPLIHDNLRRIAASFLRRDRTEHTLETASLVNEAYLRLVDQEQVRWKDRAHFLAIAGQTMRRILVDHARRRDSAKRGGGVVHRDLKPSNILVTAEGEPSSRALPAVVLE